MAIMREKQNVCRVLLWKPEARNYMEDLNVQRRVVFSLSERMGRVGTDWVISQRIGTSGLLSNL